MFRGKLVKADKIPDPLIFPSLLTFPSLNLPRFPPASNPLCGWPVMDPGRFVGFKVWSASHGDFWKPNVFERNHVPGKWYPLSIKHSSQTRRKNGYLWFMPYNSRRICKRSWGRLHLELSLLEEPWLFKIGIPFKHVPVRVSHGLRIPRIFPLAISKPRKCNPQPSPNHPRSVAQDDWMLKDLEDFEWFDLRFLDDQPVTWVLLVVLIQRHKEL